MNPNQEVENKNAVTYTFETNMSKNPHLNDEFAVATHNFLKALLTIDAESEKIVSVYIPSSLTAQSDRIQTPVIEEVSFPVPNAFYVSMHQLVLSLQDAYKQFRDREVEHNADIVILHQEISLLKARICEQESKISKSNEVLFGLGKRLEESERLVEDHQENVKYFQSISHRSEEETKAFRHQAKKLSSELVMLREDLERKRSLEPHVNSTDGRLESLRRELDDYKRFSIATHILRDAADQDVQSFQFPNGFRIVENFERQSRTFRPFLSMLLDCLHMNIVPGSRHFYELIPAVVKAMYLSARTVVESEFLQIQSHIMKEFDVPNLLHDHATKAFFLRTMQRIHYPRILQIFSAITIENLQNMIPNVAMGELESVVTELKEKDELDRSHESSFQGLYRFFGQFLLESKLSDPCCEVENVIGEEVLCRNSRYRLVNDARGETAVVILPGLYYCDALGRREDIPKVEGTIFCYFESEVGEFQRSVFDPISQPVAADFPQIESSFHSSPTGNVPFDLSSQVASIISSESSFVLAPASVAMGLPNVGGTCYLNSILQCIFHTSTFEQIILNQNIAATYSGAEVTQQLAYLWNTLLNDDSNERVRESFTTLLQLLQHKRPKAFGEGELKSANFALRELFSFLHVRNLLD